MIFSFVWQLLILIIRDLQLSFLPLISQSTKSVFYTFLTYAKIQTLIKHSSQPLVQTDLYFIQTDSVYCKLYQHWYNCFPIFIRLQQCGKTLQSWRAMTTTRVGLCYWTLSLQIIAQSTRNGKCSQIIGEQSQLYLHTNTNTISIRRLHSQGSVILSMWEQQYYKYNNYLS